MIFQEEFGEVSEVQLKTYREYNISPADHDDLVEWFGADQHDMIVAAVEDFSNHGMFSPWHFQEWQRSQ